MTRPLLVAGALLVAACGRGTSTPSGTATDPVTVCERVADVCRIDRSRLGVCTQSQVGSRLVCASQH